MPKTVKYGKSGNPDVQIWQPCWSEIILSASIRLLSLRNMGLATKIMFLSPLEPITCRKHLNMGNLATLSYKSGNPVCRTLF